MGGRQAYNSSSGSGSPRRRRRGVVSSCCCCASGAALTAACCALSPLALPLLPLRCLPRLLVRSGICNREGVTFSGEPARWRPSRGVLPLLLLSKLLLTDIDV